jgi:WD40 repeat protein
VYPSGKYIVFKNLDDPTDSFIYRAHSHTTTVAKVSPNGYWVASGDVTGKLRIWSLDNPEHLTKLEYPAFAGAIRDVDWGDDSKKLVVVGEGSGIMAKVITWDTGNSAGEMLGHAKRVLSCAFKPQRPFRIFTCAEDFRVCFYSGPPFKMTHSRQPFTNFVNCIRYSPDGAHVACVGEKKIQLFDGTSGEETLCLEKAHEGTVYSVAWCPDSTRFATAAADKSVKIWNLALECLVTHSFASEVGEMQVSVCWTKSKLVSISLSGNITLLNTEASGALSAPLQDHQVSVLIGPVI